MGLLLALGITVAFFGGVYIAGTLEAEMERRRDRRFIEPLPPARLLRRRG